MPSAAAPALPAAAPAAADLVEEVFYDLPEAKFRILKPLPLGEYRLFRKFKGLNLDLWHPKNRDKHFDESEESRKLAESNAKNPNEPKSELESVDNFLDQIYYVNDETAIRFLRKDEFDLDKTSKSLRFHLKEWLPKYQPEKMRLNGEKNKQLRALNAEGFFRYMGRDKSTGWAVMAGDARCMGPYTKQANSEDWLLYYIFLAAQLEKIFKLDEVDDVDLLRKIFPDFEDKISDISLDDGKNSINETFRAGGLIDISKICENNGEEKLKSLFKESTIKDAEEKKCQHDFYWCQKTYSKNMKMALENKDDKYYIGHADKFSDPDFASGILMPDRRCKWIMNAQGSSMSMMKRPYFVTRISEVLSDYFPDTMQYFIIMNLPMGKMFWGMIKAVIPAKASLRAMLNSPYKDKKDAEWLEALTPRDIDLNSEKTGWKASGVDAHWTGYVSPNFSLELGEKACPNVQVGSKVLETRRKSEIISPKRSHIHKKSELLSPKPSTRRCTSSRRNSETIRDY